jgi:hypothetical protein
MSSFLVLVHALVSIALVGAITHQAISLWRVPAVASRSLLLRLRGVPGQGYTNAVIGLYLTNFALGIVLYPFYRLEVRPLLEDLYLLAPAGLFETKEHLAALGLGLLPLYWLAWQGTGGGTARRPRLAVTLLLAGFVWWALLAGHIANNIRGI